MRLSFGECVLDTDRRVLERGGQPVHLSPKAFEVLHFLMARSPRAVSKQELLDEIWLDVVVEEQNVKSVVFEIRAALGADEGAIRTVQRFGYAFAGDVRPRATPARLVSADRTFSLESGENVIGRDPSCRIQISSTGVSRRHARIVVSDNSVFLEDLGSKNGTWRNDERITGRVDLCEGDAIRVGIAKLTFRSAPIPATTTTIP